MFKIFLIIQGFKETNKSQEKLFKHMCNFGAQAKWRNMRRALSSYLDAETRKYQYHMPNTYPLESIAGYKMEDDASDWGLNGVPHRSLNLINGSISSYCSNINSPKQLDLIKKEEKLTYVIGDIESYILGVLGQEEER